MCNYIYPIMMIYWFNYHVNVHKSQHKFASLGMTTSYQTNLQLFFYNNTEKQIYQMCVKIFFEERDNEGIIIRCVEPIMYNEHVVSFRQKPLSIVLLPLLLINNFIAAAQLNSPSSKRNNLDSSICMLIISLGISRNTVPVPLFSLILSWYNRFYISSFI